MFCINCPNYADITFIHIYIFQFIILIISVIEISKGVSSQIQETSRARTRERAT